MLVAQSCPTLCNPMDCSLSSSSCPWDHQGKNTGVGCSSLLQGIFPTQGSNPNLLPCRQIKWKENESVSLSTGSIPGSGRSPEEGNGNPLGYSCLKNLMDRGAWQATNPCGRKESDMIVCTRQTHTHTHTHTHRVRASWGTEPSHKSMSQHAPLFSPTPSIFIQGKAGLNKDQGEEKDLAREGISTCHAFLTRK